jgi:hypothetical protein
VALLAEADEIDEDVLVNVCRYSIAISIASRQASGSSPLTWKIGASTILATSVQ